MQFPDRQELTSHQLARLRRLLSQLVPGNAFYTERLRSADLDQGVASLEEFQQNMPFTTKAELAEDQLRRRDSLEGAFRRNYNLRVPVTVAAPGELPRFELKAKRWIRL